MGDFEAAFKDTVGLEGGYVNDPNDPGGETKFGISKRSYPGLDIAALTVDQARDIYRRDFWEKLQLYNVHNPYVAAEIFDTAVNCGPGTAASVAQRALNFLEEGAVVEDGSLGPKTMAAVNRWCALDPEALFRALNGEQYMVYRQIVFLRRREGKTPPARGWMKRIQNWNG